MLQRLLCRALIVTLVLSSAAGCKSAGRDEVHDGRVVVVFSEDRASDATTARDNLSALGFRVHVEPEGPPVRTSSVAAVYEAGRHEGRVEAVERALAGIDGVELRPFLLPGPDGTDVVVWLISRGREAGTPAPLPAVD
jgi:phage terminase large subunit-like protein